MRRSIQYLGLGFHIELSFIEFRFLIDARKTGLAQREWAGHLATYKVMCVGDTVLGTLLSRTLVSNNPVKGRGDF